MRIDETEGAVADDGADGGEAARDQQELSSDGDGQLGGVVQGLSLVPGDIPPDQDHVAVGQPDVGESVGRARPDDRHLGVDVLDVSGDLVLEAAGLEGVQQDRQEVVHVLGGVQGEVGRYLPAEPGDLLEPHDVRPAERDLVGQPLGARRKIRGHHLGEDAGRHDRDLLRGRFEQGRQSRESLVDVAGHVADLP